MIFQIFQAAVHKSPQRLQGPHRLQSQSQRIQQRIQTQTTLRMSSAAAIWCLTQRPPSGETCSSSKPGTLDYRCAFVGHLKTNFPHTFQLNISTRYYWRKSSAFQGIRLTKVSTKWPRINYVDAAAEVPYKDLVYLFEGKFHRDSFHGLTTVVAP